MPRKKQGLGARGALAMKERLRKKNQIVEKAHKKTKLKYQKYGVRKKPGKVAKISGRAIGSYTAGSGRLGGSSRSGGSGRLGGGGKRSLRHDAEHRGIVAAADARVERERKRDQI